MGNSAGSISDFPSIDKGGFDFDLGLGKGGFDFGEGGIDLGLGGGILEAGALGGIIFKGTEIAGDIADLTKGRGGGGGGGNTLKPVGPGVPTAVGPIIFDPSGYDWPDEWTKPSGSGDTFDPRKPQPGGPTPLGPGPVGPGKKAPTLGPSVPSSGGGGGDTFDPRKPQPGGPIPLGPGEIPGTKSPTLGPTVPTTGGTTTKRPTGQPGEGRGGEGKSGGGTVVPIPIPGPGQGQSGGATGAKEPEGGPGGSETQEETDKKKKDDEEDDEDDPRFPQEKKDDKEQAETAGSSTSKVVVEPINLSILQILKKTDKNQLLLSDIHDKEYEKESNKADIIVASDARPDTRNTLKESQLDDYIKYNHFKNQYIVDQDLELDKIDLDLMNFQKNIYKYRQHEITSLIDKNEVFKEIEYDKFEIEIQYVENPNEINLTNNQYSRQAEIF